MNIDLFIFYFFKRSVYKLISFRDESLLNLFIFNIFRGIISVAAAAEWSTSPSVLENVQNSYWPHRHLEVRTYIHTYVRLHQFHIFN